MSESMDMTTAKRCGYGAAFLTLCAAVSLAIDIADFSGAPTPPDCPEHHRFMALNNTACIRESLQLAHNYRGFTLGFELTEGLASFLLIPAVLSMGEVLGKGTSAKTLLVPPLVAVAMVRFFELTTMAGVTQVSTWMAEDWNLDAIGFEALVISTFMSRAAFMWLSAMDSLLFGIGLITSARLTYNEGTFNRKWAHLGYFLGVLNILVFILDIARFASFRVFMMASGVLQMLSGMILTPIWIIWLANSLGKASGVRERLATGAGDSGL